MQTNNAGLFLLALATFFGLVLGGITFGQSIKYGMTRQACITQHMTAEQCVQWNHYWEKNA